MRLVGTKTNIIVSQYLYQYLTTVVEKLVKQHRGKGRSFISAFRVGCATRLRQRLENRRKQMEEKGLTDDCSHQSTSALVVRSMFEKNTLAIETYLQQEGVKCKTQKSAEISSDLGFSFGYIAGDKISLNYLNHKLKKGSIMEQLTGN